MVPVGSALMCFRFLQVAWAFKQTGELPHHDHGHVDGLDESSPVPAPGDEDAIYRMRDELHPRDMPGGIDRRGEDRGPPKGQPERRRRDSQITRDDATQPGDPKP